MKILHVTNYLPGHHKTCGGAEHAAYRQITALQSNGINNVVNVVVTLKEDFSRKEDFKCYAIKTIETYLEKWIGNPACAINRRFLYYDFVPKNEFRQIVKKEQPDLINFYNFNRLSFSLLDVGKEFSLPCVLSIYDYWYFCPNEILVKNDEQLCYQFHNKNCLNCYRFERFDFLLRWTLLYRKRLFDKFLKKFDVFLVLSRSSRLLLEKYGIPTEKIKLLPQFYHSANSQSLPSSDSLGYDGYILFAGWLNHKKGLHVLVRAMRDVRARIKNVKLVVLGMDADKKYLNQIKKYVAENSLEPNIEFRGKVGSDEFKQYLHNAKLLVVPEQWENMSPVIIIEAMFAGIPIVAGRIGGLPEFVIDGENGYLAEYNNPKDFAEKIIRLLSSQQLRSKFSQKNKELFQRLFNEEATLNKLFQTYDKAIGDNNNNKRLKR